MNDRELITYIKHNRADNEPWVNYNKAVTALWERYQNQIHNNWHKLVKVLGGSDLVLSKHGDFYDEAQEAFMTALTKIDLNKVENDNWKFVGYLNFYLTNLRTKLHREIKKETAFKPIDSMSDLDEDCALSADLDVEEAYRESDGFRYEPEYVLEQREGEENCKRALRECLNKWTDTQKEIYRRLVNNEKKLDISKALNIPTPRLYAECNKMKRDLKLSLGILD